MRYFLFFILIGCLNISYGQNTIYFDSKASNSNENGSLEYPYNSLNDITFSDNTICLLKRGSVFKINTFSSLILNANNLKFDTYGQGSKPVIMAVTKDAPSKLIDHHQGRIYFKNIHFRSEKPGNTNKGIYLYNVTDCIIDSCIISGFSTGVQSTLQQGKLRISKTVIEDTWSDGINILNPTGVDIVIVDSCHIKNTGTGNEIDPSAKGSCIKFSAGCDSMWIHHNILDHSYNTSSYCLSTGDNSKGVIEYNTMMTKNYNSTVVCVGESPNTLLRYNIFETKGTSVPQGQKPSNGLCNHGKAQLNYNIFRNIPGKAYITGTKEDRSVLKNNIFYNCGIGITGFFEPAKIYNNIFYSCNNAIEGGKNLSVDYNSFYRNINNGNVFGPNDSFSDPMFYNPDSYDFRLQDQSPCLKSAMVIANPKIGMSGTDVSTGMISKISTTHNLEASTGTSSMRSQDASSNQSVSGLQVVPNPEYNQLTLSFNDKSTHPRQVKIYNDRGEIIFRKTVPTFEKIVEVNMEFSIGNYIIVVSSPVEKLLTKQLVVY
jgi:hypothetical protein